jgi:hypothetical protein
VTTETDERIATLIRLVTGKEGPVALIEILEAIRASQEAQKLLDKRAYAHPRATLGKHAAPRESGHPLSRQDVVCRRRVKAVNF